MYAIDIAHAEHIAEFFRGKGVAAYAISSKTPLPERKLLIEGFRKSVFGNGKDSIFENSPVPSYPEEGLHRFPLNPLSPQGTGDLKPGRLGLYEQTSSRPKGLLVEFYATELRVFERRGRGCARWAVLHEVRPYSGG